MTEREQFIAWLNDAYSTEIAMMPVLKNHAEDARDYPEIYRRDMQHLAETKRQAKRLEKMIEELGGKVSFAKTALGKIVGLGQSISTEIFPDELIKNFLADFAAESFEIASYQSLIATAKRIGEHQCVPALEASLREEIAMARWIEEHIPMATAESLKITTQKNRKKHLKNNSTHNSKQKDERTFLGMPPAVATIVTGGALGAAAVYLMSSDKRKTSLSKNENLNSNQNIVSDLPVVSTAVVETVVIAVEDVKDQTSKTPLNSSTARMR